jgi:anti-sigma factor RsiW
VSAAAEMTCRELVELVTDYLEERLPPAERARFDAHLEVCEGCRAYLDQMRATVRLLGRLPEDTLPPELEERLMRAFRDWRP